MGYTGPGFTRLIVEPLEGYGFTWQSSRYNDFESHVRSLHTPLGGYAVGAVGGALSSVPVLLSDTLPQIRDAMKPGRDPEARQRLFERWTEALGIPIRARTERLEITRIFSSDGVELLLLESPEALPFSEDVSLSVWRRVLTRPGFVGPGAELEGTVFRVHGTSDALRSARWAVSPVVSAEPPGRMLHIYGLDDAGRPRREGHLVETVWPTGEGGPVSGSARTADIGEFVLLDDGGRVMLPDPFPVDLVQYQARHVRILSDGDEKRALVIPSDVTTGAWSILPHGRYRLDFVIDRERYRTAESDPLARLTGTVSMFVML